MSGYFGYFAYEAYALVDVITVLSIKDAVSLLLPLGAIIALFLVSAIADVKKKNIF
jgi:hypothetical protein